MARLTRRSLLIAGGAAAAFGRFPAIAQSGRLAHGMFTHGVASGDPMPDAVILWTRFVTSDAKPGTIRWEIAEDWTFARIAAGGDASAAPERDFCVKIDAKGLKPGRDYVYRFISAYGVSVTGLTKTAPSAGIERMKLALFSCANLSYGYFHAYRDAAARAADLDLVVHVGDYFYEYARGKYPDKGEVVPGRIIEPETEIITFSDYHRRYASYRDDADLQELHRVLPWVTVWDDHELANDTWTDGAENHHPDTQGPWPERRATAVQAYLDWMPIRHDPAAGLAIYRRYDWGDLATLMALDTRLIGRMHQLSYKDTLEPLADKDDATFNAAAQGFAKGLLADPSRTLMGQPQEQWLSGELKRSKAMGAVWQVLAQQIVAGHQVTPEAYTGFLAPDVSESSRRFMTVRARLGKLGMDWNLDAWGGYPAARERLLADCTANANNALVLSGDSHNAWAYNLGGADGRPAAIEVAGQGVTSPGAERSAKAAPPGGREAAMLDANPELAWCDLSNKGYALVSLTRTTAEARFVASGPVNQPGAPNIGETAMVSEASPSGPSNWAKA